jgi:4-hydroxybenzoate polyprenyltransferase
MHKNTLLSMLDYVFVLRPTLLFPVWLMALAGYKYGLAETPPRHSILLAVSLLSLLAGAVYILNQYADHASDRINKKLFLISEGHISPLTALCEAALLILFAVGLAFMMGKEIGLLFIAVLANACPWRRSQKRENGLGRSWASRRPAWTDYFSLSAGSAARCCSPTAMAW